MSTEEVQAIEAATREFYEAINTMVNAGGLEQMEAIWHHGEEVTVQHPMKSDWARGWDEVFATWQAAAAFGREGAGNASVVSLSVVPLADDAAYATAVFKAAESWGGETLMCTDILRKIDGRWKIVHHHADPSPKMTQALMKMMEG